jgi:hypothetical protein
MDMKPTMGLETTIKPCYKGSHEKGWTRLFKMQHIGPASAAALSPRVAIRASSTRDFPTQKLFTKVGAHPLTNRFNILNDQPSHGPYSTCTPGQEPCQDVFTNIESSDYSLCLSQRNFFWNNEMASFWSKEAIRKHHKNYQYLIVKSL